MNKTNQSKYKLAAALLSLLIIPSLLTSCGEDRWAAYEEQTRASHWIEDTMRVWYYWNEEMPGEDDSRYMQNYFAEPETFFKYLLSKNDKFSYIDSLKTGATTRSISNVSYSYGIEVGSVTLSMEGQKDTLVAAALYVVPDSPAAEAGLDRGALISSVGGVPITKSNLSLLNSGPATTIGLLQIKGSEFVSGGEVQMAAARDVDDNPVHYANVYADEAGHRIGYLVYNHFSMGHTNGTEYDDALREVFADFKAKNVNELILDLRYNNGGYQSCAELLSTMIAPATAIGQVMGYTRYNNVIGSQPREMRFDADVIGSGANLDLKRLYVLTGSYTASASELVINCLNPYMEVVLIGTKTIGKNVGSLTFTNHELQIEMHPIVCKVFNSEDKSDYESGFTPNYQLSDLSSYDTFLPFGNIKENMLSKALEVITTPAETTTRATRTTTTRTTITPVEMPERRPVMTIQRGH